MDTIAIILALIIAMYAIRFINKHSNKMAEDMNKKNKSNTFKEGDYPNLSKYFSDNNLMKADFYFVITHDKKGILNGTFNFDKDLTKNFVDLMISIDPSYQPQMQTHTLYLEQGYFSIAEITIENLTNYNGNTILLQLEQALASGDNTAKREGISNETLTKLALNMLTLNELNDLVLNNKLDSHQMNLVANSYRHYEDYDFAEKAFLSAIELDPSNDQPYGNLMSLYILQSKFEQCNEIYQIGMKYADNKSFIIFQDGRYHYTRGSYGMAYSAALQVLTMERMQNEVAFILGVQAQLNLAEESKDDVTTNKYNNSAKEMLSQGLYIFPKSEGLLMLKEKFEN